MQRQSSTPEGKETIIEGMLGYEFRRVNHSSFYNDTRHNLKQLIHEALTHSSARTESAHPVSSRNYERLELLGDSVLTVALTTHLYERHDFEEGTMTQIIAQLRSNECLANIAQCNPRLDSCIYRNTASDDTLTDNVRAAVIEALIGAVYLDSQKNMGKVAEVIEKLYDYRLRPGNLPQTAEALDRLNQASAQIVRSQQAMARVQEPAVEMSAHDITRYLEAIRDGVINSSGDFKMTLPAFEQMVHAIPNYRRVISMTLSSTGLTPKSQYEQGPGVTLLFHLIELLSEKKVPAKLAVLIRCGIDLDHRNSQGQTIVEYAQSRDVSDKGMNWLREQVRLANKPKKAAKARTASGTSGAATAISAAAPTQPGR